MDARDDDMKRLEPVAVTARRRAPLPLVSADERAFWRRAVEVERARQRCGRPAPFPFQPA
jgi:hypothetical protein